MYFRLARRHAEAGEYVYSCWGEIFKINSTTENGGVVYNEFFDQYNGYYHAEIMGPWEYMVLELVNE